MAIFSKNKQEQPASRESTLIPAHPLAHRAHILKHARITEKATAHTLRNAYVFDVSPDATKRDIMRAVHEIYKVMPRKVTVAAIPRKETRSRRTGKPGMKGGGKKAYVYLKKGETINVS